MLHSLEAGDMVRLRRTRWIHFEYEGQEEYRTGAVFIVIESNDDEIRFVDPRGRIHRWNDYSFNVVDSLYEKV